jgi:hypothetical protein
VSERGAHYFADRCRRLWNEIGDLPIRARALRVQSAFNLISPASHSGLPSAGALVAECDRGGIDQKKAEDTRVVQERRAGLIDRLLF